MFDNILEKKNKFVPYRNRMILSLCKQKTVLNIGCLEKGPEWILDFCKISKVAKECVGVEIRHEVAKRLVKCGYKVICGNAETINPGKNLMLLWQVK
ncbi:MAG: hypothetical protein NC827_09705 [Candidatus Omnitrophica bacterium]|nr:hypothetical protein [Candidatus Omnitrophota bacterium]